MNKLIKFFEFYTVFAISFSLGSVVEGGGISHNQFAVFCALSALITGLLWELYWIYTH